MKFVRSHYTCREFLKQCYNFMRLSVHNYGSMISQNKFTTIPDEEEKDLTYRVVIIDNYKGRVAWKNCTGNYVLKGHKLCDIINEDNLIHTINSPISGMIANRFVDEGLYVRENSLICLMKVCNKPVSTVDRESYIYERKLNTKVSDELEGEKVEKRREIEQIFNEQKRFRAKDFIQPIDEEDDEEKLDNLSKGLEQPVTKKGIPADIMHKKRQHEFDKYTPEYVQDEIRHLQVERDLTAIKLSEKASNEFYKPLIDDNFTPTREPLRILYGSERSKRFLQATVEIDLSSAFKFALNEGGRTNIKFELTYLIILGCLYAFKELPYLINSSDKSVNMTIGLIAGGKLTFPFIKNIEKVTNLKDRLDTLRANLIDGKDIENYSETRSAKESLAITNEWDYGNISGPSCLYASSYANLSLNAIMIKPYVLEDFKTHFLPVMSTTLMFSNEKIDGQDALLFLNKLKESIEDIKHEVQ